MTDPVAEKAALRLRMREAVRALSPGDASRRSLKVCDHLLAAPELATARCVLLTLPLAGEVDLAGVARRLLDGGYEVCLPRVDWHARAMAPVRIESLIEGIVMGRHGVREPTSGDTVALEALDAILVPGLAFDLAGGRLGRGGGFFDRFLAAARRARRVWVCGCAFDCQVIERVPLGPHDVRLDALATESGVVACHNP